MVESKLQRYYGLEYPTRGVVPRGEDYYDYEVIQAFALPFRYRAKEFIILDEENVKKLKFSGNLKVSLPYKL